MNRLNRTGRIVAESFVLTKKPPVSPIDGYRYSFDQLRWTDGVTARFVRTRKKRSA